MVAEGEEGEGGEVKWYRRDMGEGFRVPETIRQYNWARMIFRIKPDGTGKPKMNKQPKKTKSRIARNSRRTNR